MSEFNNVEDFLALAKPSLRERAKQEYVLQEERKSRAAEEEELRLAEAVREWMIENLEVAPDAAAEWEFKGGAHNQSQRKVTWEYDGLRFLAHFTKKKVMSRNSSQFEDETVYEESVNVMVNISGTSYNTIRSLADLGKLL